MFKKFNVPILIPKIDEPNTTIKGSVGSGHTIVYSDKNTGVLRTLDKNGEGSRIQTELKNVIYVGPNQDISTLPELKVKMLELESSGQTDGIQIIFDNGVYEVDDTLHINFSFPVSITTQANTIFRPTANLVGKPALQVYTDLTFYNFIWDSSNIPTWKDDAGSNVIEILGNGYYEFQNFLAYGGYTIFNVKSAPETLFIFNFEITDFTQHGILIDYPSSASNAGIDIEMGNFYNGNTAIKFNSGNNIDFILKSCIFSDDLQYGIVYDKANIPAYTQINIDSCNFYLPNSNINALSGFDFTDAYFKDIIIKNSIGLPNFDAAFFYNGNEKNFTIVPPSADAWYQLNTNGDIAANYSINNRFSIADDGTKTDIIYLPSISASLSFSLDTVISTDKRNTNVYVGIFLNGSLVSQGATRLNAAKQPFNVNFSGLIKTISANDVIAIGIKSNRRRVTIILESLNINIKTH